MKGKSISFTPASATVLAIGQGKGKKRKGPPKKNLKGKSQNGSVSNGTKGKSSSDIPPVSSPKEATSLHQQRPLEMKLP